MGEGYGVLALRLAVVPALPLNLCGIPAFAGMTVKIGGGGAIFVRFR